MPRNVTCTHTPADDVEEQVAWCEKNLEKCEKIAERATLYVHNMLFHMSSEKETTEIQVRIMERYTHFFNSTTPNTVKATKDDVNDDKKEKNKEGKRRFKIREHHLDMNCNFNFFFPLYIIPFQLGDTISFSLQTRSGIITYRT
jgi:hypothetical protein